MIDNDLKKFLQNKDILLTVGADSDGYSVRICQDMDLNELSTILCYVIKTAVSSMEDASELNELAEFNILQSIEDKLIEDETSYSDLK